MVLKLVWAIFPNWCIVQVPNIFVGVGGNDPPPPKNVANIRARTNLLIFHIIWITAISGSPNWRGTAKVIQRQIVKSDDQVSFQRKPGRPQERSQSKYVIQPLMYNDTQNGQMHKKRKTSQWRIAQTVKQLLWTREFQVYAWVFTSNPALVCWEFELILVMIVWQTIVFVWLGIPCIKLSRAIAVEGAILVKALIGCHVSKKFSFRNILKKCVWNPNSQKLGFQELGFQTFTEIWNPKKNGISYTYIPEIQISDNFFLENNISNTFFAHF